MKKSALLVFALLAVGAAAAFSLKNQPQKTTSTITWLTWEQAAELQKTAPKKIMVDVFTDWCGWCKKMDKSTFEAEAVTKYMADNFYCVKLDAEQKADINWNGTRFTYEKPEGQPRGVHTFAYSLLDGKMGYPTIVYLNEKMERILISPGYKDEPMLLKELKFTVDEIYKTKSWEDYQAGK